MHTVNLASRMESNGFPMNVVMSEATRNLIKESYDAVSLGEFYIKGKGQMNIWLLKHEGLEWQNAVDLSAITRK
jgi:class 3 adenylate cyclase